MQLTPCTPFASRRELLQFFSCGALAVTTASVGYAADFWNKKPSTTWSGDEIEVMKSKSPWAKKIRAEMSGGFGGGRGGGGGDSMDRGGSSGTFGGMTGADSNGIGGGGGGPGGGGGRGGGRGGEGGGGGATAQGPDLIVRWENAKPMLEATKLALPVELASQYAISVTGLPPQMIAGLLAGGGGRGRSRGREGEPPADAVPAPPEDPAARQKAMVDRLLHSVSLSAKGRDPQSATLIRQTNGNATLIFGFPKDALPLTAADKDVLFTMKLGPLTVKAKFEPKDMMYQGELAL